MKEKPPKTILVDQDKLTQYIVENCIYYSYNGYSGQSCRRKLHKEACSLSDFARDLYCPDDCPRLKAKEYGCDKGRCPHVKAKIKKFKA